MRSQGTDQSSRRHLRLLSCPTAGQTVHPITTEASVLRLKFSQRPPWLWRWLLGRGPLGAKYLRLYCTTIGFNKHVIRRQRLSTSFRKAARYLGPWMDLPEMPVRKDVSDVYQALRNPKGLPSVLLHTGEMSQCYETPDGISGTLYSQLPDDGDTVRLLVLDRKSGLTQLKGRIVVVRLSNFPAYRALSYEWGPSDERESAASQIELNGTMTRVTPNLYHFLMKLRRLPDHLPLWIDALCINQEDEVEKSRQVAIMGNIYQKAESVLIWLGQEGEGSGNLFRLISGSSSLQLMPYEAQLPPIKRRNRFPSLPWMPGEVQTRSVKKWLQSRPTKQLLKRSYWSRAWIVQEVVLARSATLFCGEQHIEFQDAESLLFTMNAIQGTSLWSLLYHRISIRNAKLEERHQDHPDSRALIAAIGRLPTLMSMYQKSESHRVHDKVYSLLALCSYYKDGTNILTPDYRLSPVELFFKAFNSFIEARNPKYADILRRALKLEWQDLLLQTKPKHDAVACQSDIKNAILWDIAWAAKITTSSTTSSSPWIHFQTDSIERHQHIDEHIHLLPQPETEGITLIAPQAGDFVVGLAGTDLAIIVADELRGPVRGIAIMTGEQPQNMSLLMKIARSKDLDNLTIVDDGVFPVKVCVHQFMQLLACAESKLPHLGDVPYQQWTEELEH